VHETAMKLINRELQGVGHRQSFVFFCVLRCSGCVCIVSRVHRKDNAIFSSWLTYSLFMPFPLFHSDVAAMAVTAPNYVLEESLSSQRLWKDTAGNRPPQPMEERAFFEKMWSQNFIRSQVQYQMPVDVLTATSPISLSPFADGNFDSARADDLSSYNMSATQAPRAEQDVAEATLMSRLHDTRANDFSAKAPVSHSYQQTVINKTVKGYGADGDLTVLVKGDNVFGTTVSKSFARTSDNGGPIVGVDTVNISVASYRVVQVSETMTYGRKRGFAVVPSQIFFCAFFHGSRRSWVNMHNS
jgi:hypothetical protein